MCDLKVGGALLFRCMIVRLYWHFSNFPWFCKVFLQTFLHFASQFCNLKVILKLGGDFAAISKLGDDFATISKLGNHFAAISQLKGDFAAEKYFCSLFRSFEMRGTVLQNGTRVPKSGFAAAKHPSKWCLGCEILAQLCALVFKRP